MILMNNFHIVCIIHVLYPTSAADSHHEILKERVYEELIDLGLGEPRYWVNVDSLGNAVEEVPVSPRSRADYDFVR